MQFPPAPLKTPWPLPAGVPTALIPPETVLLQRYAARAGLVLEIGTWYGYSAIAMALAGAHVITVDPHTELGSPGPGLTTWEPFQNHLASSGVADRITVARMNSDQYFGELAKAPPGPTLPMAFIDGDHNREQVARDIANAHQALMLDGKLVLHDIHNPGWPGVTEAAAELLPGLGWEKIDQVRWMAVYIRRRHG